ncbi:MAG: hypothetical protein UU47_C0007G0037 [candidate division TM6 bacterium GW2011_GWE2_41_16]|nr:MAG: hypothetical protein UU47_C0007G0037 [candidate division TM6 bacterium GW2011_GWE2_41_16]
MIWKNKKIALSIVLLLGVVSASSYVFYRHRQTLGNVTIQRYATGDDQMIRTFFKDNWYWMVGDECVDFSLDYVLTHMVSSNRPQDARPLTIDMLYKDKKTIAFIMYFQKDSFNGKILFVGVQQNWRGHGYSGKLTQHALKTLCAQGCINVEIVTRVQNTSAQAAYVKAGFVEIARDNTYVTLMYKCPR